MDFNKEFDALWESIDSGISVEEAYKKIGESTPFISDVLGQVIANGGVIGGKPKLQAFTITMDQLSKVQISQEPIRVTQLVDLISAAVGDSQIKKLRTTVITDLLLEKGFMEKQIGPDGKSVHIPTPNGLMIGLSIQVRRGQYGEYHAVFYSTAAQQFVLDNLIAMLAE